MGKPTPSINADWLDALISTGTDPRDLPAEMIDIIKQVFDFGAECAHLEHEAESEAAE